MDMAQQFPTMSRTVAAILMPPFSDEDNHSVHNSAMCRAQQMLQLTHSTQPQDVVTGGHWPLVTLVRGSIGALCKYYTFRYVDRCKCTKDAPMQSEMCCGCVTTAPMQSISLWAKGKLKLVSRADGLALTTVLVSKAVQAQLKCQHAAHRYRGFCVANILAIAMDACMKFSLCEMFAVYI